jgi:hypothetical protein
LGGIHSRGRPLEFVPIQVPRPRIGLSFGSRVAWQEFLFAGTTIGERTNRNSDQQLTGYWLSAAMSARAQARGNMLHANFASRRANQFAATSILNGSDPPPSNPPSTACLTLLKYSLNLAPLPPTKSSYSLCFESATIFISSKERVRFL